MQLLFATGNRHKVSEANSISSGYAVVFEQLNLLYPEVRAENVQKVAEEGVKYVYGQLNKPVVVEDSGLFIEALDGFPGAYSAFVFEKIGCEGILRLLSGFSNRKARFVSAIGYHDESGTQVFIGEVEGYVTEEMRGEGGFGYDPVFKAADHPKTFAEDPEHKNRVSHRRKAVTGLCRFLKAGRRRL